MKIGSTSNTKTSYCMEQTWNKIIGCAQPLAAKQHILAVKAIFIHSSTTIKQSVFTQGEFETQLCC